MRRIDSACVIKGPSGEVVHGLPFLFTVQVLSAKCFACLQVKGAPHCVYALLSAQAENAVRCDGQLRDLWPSKSAEPATSLALELKDRYSVEWRKNEQQPEHPGMSRDCCPLVEADSNIRFFSMGLTPFDRNYFEMRNERCRKETAKVTSKLPDPMKPSKKCKRV